MAITIYTGNSVVVIDEDVLDFEVECDKCDEDEGIEYDVDGNAWWYDEENDVLYVYDEEADDWVVYDDADDEVDAAE